MVVCPDCGYPYPDETYTLGARDVICANCKWKGSSTELLQTKGELEGGVEQLQQLYQFLGRVIAPQITVKAVELGFLTGDKTPENYRRIAKVLSRVSRASFKELLQALVDDAEEYAKEEKTDGRTIH